MKALLLAFLALASTQAHALNGSGNVSNIIGLGVSGPAVTSVNSASSSIPLPTGKTVFTITAGDAQTAATNGNYYPFYKNGVAFQAGASGTFCFSIRLIAATANTGVQLVSATASFAYNASSLTGAVYQLGASGKSAFMISGTSNAESWTYQPGVYTFGANTYGGYQANNSQVFGMSLDCYDL